MPAWWEATEIAVVEQNPHPGPGLGEALGEPESGRCLSPGRDVCSLGAAQGAARGSWRKDPWRGGGGVRREPPTRALARATGGGPWLYYLQQVRSQLLGDAVQGPRAAGLSPRVSQTWTGNNTNSKQHRPARGLSTQYPARRPPLWPLCLGLKRKRPEKFPPRPWVQARQALSSHGSPACSRL